LTLKSLRQDITSPPERVTDAARATADKRTQHADACRQPTETLGFLKGFTLNEAAPETVIADVTVKSKLEACTC
jgi:hypothetical protein